MVDDILAEKIHCIVSLLMFSTSIVPGCLLTLYMPCKKYVSTAKLLCYGPLRLVC